ncbi:MAG: hypothetical protein AB8B56_16540 [Crocinitomicaceae bacterium]
MWFERLVGFEEGTMENVRSKIELNGTRLRSKVNGKEFVVGTLEIPSLEDLRKRASLESYKDRIQVEEVVGNVQAMHQSTENNGAIFQAASQFNLLEMVGPHISPEQGVGMYEYDLTQGPACAIACGAGTIYRNYFVEVNGRIGQTRDNQVDCLADIGRELRNSELNLWDMQNGYALPTLEGLQRVAQKIQLSSDEEYDTIKSKLKVGIQWDTQVTLNNSENLVSQVYCSALPVAYSKFPQEDWEDFARLILEGTYEATLYAALLNYEKTGNPTVYLTLVGGGAFGNDRTWIFESMKRAIDIFKRVPLKLKIVSYGGSNESVRNFVNSLN